MSMRSVAQKSALAGLSIAVASVAAPAFAEGSFESSLSGVLNGYESRRWEDKNLDATSTSVRFQNCNTEGNPSTVNVGLRVYRVVSLAPDQDKGAKGYNCADSGRAYWGDLQSGTYYFKIASIQGGGHLYANPVNVWY